MLALLQKVIFIQLWQKYMFKNRTLLEADPRHLPTAKMELFVLKFTAERLYVIVLSQGVHKQTQDSCQQQRWSYLY